jgi:hypothetical protein
MAFIAEVMTRKRERDDCFSFERIKLTRAKTHTEETYLPILLARGISPNQDQALCAGKR